MKGKREESIVEKLILGNRSYQETVDRALMKHLALHGQEPSAVVICCSDSRVVPEKIFRSGLGELFVIRVAGNVLDKHQLGSVEYAAAHLGCKLVLLLGHTGCGAVAAAIDGHADGFISYIVEDIITAIGEEKDADRACRMNVLHGVERIRKEFSGHPELDGIEVLGAIYDMKNGDVEWL